MTGGIGIGAFRRLTSDGLDVLDRVSFSGIEAFEITGTFRDDDVTTGDAADSIYLGGGDDVVDAGSGGDVAAGQEGDDDVSWRASSGSGEFVTVYDGPFLLDGGTGVDLLRIDFDGVDEDVTLAAGEGIALNLAMQSGGAAASFEELAFAQTGGGRDLVSQTGIVDNEIRTGDNVDEIRPGRGIDTVSGGQDFGDEAELIGFFGDRAFYEPVNLAGILSTPGDLLVADYSNSGGAIDSSVGRQFGSAVLGEPITDQIATSLRYLSTFGTYQSADGTDELTFDEIERVDLTGSDFDDRLIGTWRGSQFVIIYATGDTQVEQAVALPGPRGGDILRGGDGNDELIGLTGSDTLLGDAGDDTLIGSDPDISDGVPEGDPAELADPYELDTLTGGGGADLFVLGVEGPQSFYTGRLLNVADAQDNRAVITDFDVAEGDQLQLAGSASDYRVEVTADATLILLDDEPREIIAELQGLTGFDLESSAATYVGNGLGLGGIIGSIDLDLDLLGPIFGAPGPVVLPNLPGVPLVPALSLTSFADRAEVTGAAQALRLAAETEPEATPFDEMLTAETPWIVQENDPAALLSALFDGGTDPALTGGTLTLQGDGRAFGVFDGDPFGLGQGVALSTGAAADLDGVNLIDGGLYGPFEPDIEFEKIGEFAGSSIFRATLTGIGVELASLQLVDDGDAIGGAAGRLSGTDLDAIVLSTDRIDAIQVGDDLNDPTFLSQLAVFDFHAGGMRLTPGTQRPPVAPDLQGTTNGLVNASIATLSAFDFNGNNNAGFVTLGDFALASEELREFAGSAFNDAFRIYLNGVQLATLTDGAAATVNALQPAPFAVSHPDLVMNPVDGGPAADETRTDAFTQILSFAGRTALGENTLRIEVEDVRDGLLDSAVLVRGGSLSLVDDGGGLGTPEDPGDVRVVIDAAGIPLTEGDAPTAVPVTLSGLAELTAPVTLMFQPATDDLDLGSGAGAEHQVTLQPGDPLSFDLAARAVEDGIAEGTEYALVSVEVTSSGPLDGLPVAPLLFEVTDARTRPFDLLLGDAPDRFSRENRTAWSDAWTDPRATLSQKQAPDDAAWLPVDLGTQNPGTYGGSGLWRGDLGVSGRTLGSEAAPQEIDGTEALRVALAPGLAGDRLIVKLAAFEADDGGVGRHEAARFQFLQSGAMVAERLVDAGAGDTFDFAALPQFDELIVDAGAMDGSDFSPGALSDGTPGTPADASGFLVDTLVFYGDEPM